MPRQLPWLNQGNSGRKQTPKSKASSKALSDDEDGFFDGTILAGKGKAKAARDDNSDIDTLADASPTRHEDAVRKKPRRELSSSPPLIDDHVQPEVEYMRKGTSIFDLRDDEWMMVEDEFLETAKLFTRHMHMAEYEKLKERIDAKKKQQVETLRPVVAGARMSVEGRMRQKANAQEKRQSEAIRDVFASKQDDDDDDDDNEDDDAFVRPTSRSKIIAKPASSIIAKHDTDSDDLDASELLFKRPSSRTFIPNTITSTFSVASNPSVPGHKSSMIAQPTRAPVAFGKSALPSTTPKLPNASRRSRATPFDMLDNYVPRSNCATIPSSPMASDTASSPNKPVAESATTKEDFIEDWSSVTRMSKETIERIAKRKAERENKRKHVELEDIPTFLV